MAKIDCSTCGIDISRDLVLIATVTKQTDKRITIEVTETQDRRMHLKGERLFAFPFYLRRGQEELEFCSLPCLRKFVEGKIPK